MFAIEFEDLHARNLYQRQPFHTPNPSRSRGWCYALHIILVTLHTVLLVLLIYHPEHSVVIASDSSVMTVGLSALLQAVYTVCQFRLTEHYLWLHLCLSSTRHF